MDKHLSLHVIFLLAAACAFSQDSIQSNLSQDSSIRPTLIEGNKYPRLIYSANGQILSNQDITARLRLYPASTAELERSRDARTGVVIWLVVMGGSGTAASILRAQGNSGAQYSFAGIAVGALVAAFLSSARSNRHFNQAIKAYNKRF